MTKAALINGPNLNWLGRREPEIYGAASLDEIVSELQQHARAHGCELIHQQSNSEGELVDFIQRCAEEDVAFIVINPAAYTHTSVALRDALLAVQIPFIEVHLSNIHAREEFRRHSWLSDIATGTICGLGAAGYRLALDHFLSQQKR